MTAVTLAPDPGDTAGGGKTVVTTLWCCYCVVFLFPEQHFGLLFGNHIVDASSLVYLFTLLHGVNVF